jgi:hypothetical protein
LNLPLLKRQFPTHAILFFQEMLRTQILLLLLSITLTLHAGALAPADAQRVNSWLRANARVEKSAGIRQHVFERPKFPVYYFEQPLDHFSNETTTETFGQRYWVNSRHYSSSGPVIILDAGETSGEGEKLENVLDVWNVFPELRFALLDPRGCMQVAYLSWTMASSTYWPRRLMGLVSCWNTDITVGVTYM